MLDAGGLRHPRDHALQRRPWGRVLDGVPAAGWALIAVVGAHANLIQDDRLRLGRATLFAGLLALPFGFVTNLSLLGGGVGLAELPALMWMGLPFDLSHALGNTVIMLWTGALMVRMLTPVDVPDALEMPGVEADVHLT